MMRSAHWTIAAISVSMRGRLRGAKRVVCHSHVEAGEDECTAPVA